MSSIVENKSADVQNLIERVKNEVVQQATQEIFEQMMQLETIADLTEILTGTIAFELKEATFMTEELELTVGQKEKMQQMMQVLGERARRTYLEQIDERVKTRKIADTVSLHLSHILEEMLASIAKEVNRGALISCVAVAADTKNEKYNKIEIQSNKHSGDITIPTKGLLISTNCLEIIRNNIDEKIEEMVVQKMSKKSK